MVSLLTTLNFKSTYVGIKGAGKACPCGLPGGIGGAPPPGLLGIAGAGRPDAGGGGGTRDPPEPKDPKPKHFKKYSIYTIAKHTSRTNLSHGRSGSFLVTRTRWR